MDPSQAQIRSYRDLRVWQNGMAIAKEVYQLARALPETERFGLCAQLRRTAISIPSNIAEGHARGSTAEYVRFVLIAAGSLAELQTQLLLLRDLGYASRREVHPLLRRTAELSRMLSALRLRLQKRLRIGGSGRRSLPR